MTDLPRLAVTRKELAKMLAVSERQVVALEADGRIGPRPIRFGRCVRYPIGELSRWIDAQAPSREEWQQANGTVGGQVRLIEAVNTESATPCGGGAGDSVSAEGGAA